MNEKAVSENVNSRCDGWWEWLTRADKPPYEITGKYLFFSADRDLLIRIAIEELEDNGFHEAKVPMAGRNHGDDYVLCLYYENDSRKRKLATKYRQRTDVKYRYWKSDEETLAGNYSEQYLNAETTKPRQAVPHGEEPITPANVTRRPAQQGAAPDANAAGSVVASRALTCALRLICSHQ